MINNEFSGSVSAFLSQIIKREGVQGLIRRWPYVFLGSKAFAAWRWFVGFGVLQAAMQLLVPGKVFRGPLSPMGNVPEYKVRTLYQHQQL